METHDCILVVDDERPNRTLLRAMLSPWWEVVEAPSGAEALEVLASRRVDLVLLDVMMPESDGLAICRRIRQQPRDCFLPIVLVTALGNQEDRNLGLEAGADDFLRKPVDRQELLLRVTNFLKLRHQEQIIGAQIAELRKLQSLKDDMVSLLVHDLRNPLSCVLSSVELALGTAHDEEQRGDLERALRHAEALGSALDETLQVRLFEENAVVARRLECDVSAVVRAAVATHEPLARRRHIQLHSVFDGHAGAWVDARLLQRAVENLLSNALKYSPANGTIDVRTGHRGGTLEIEVSDRGPGVPDPLKRVLFERFGSVEVSRGGERRGVGLGLYLVKLVAQAHGGDVDALDRLGGGSVFRLRLGSSLAVPARDVA